MSAHEVSPIVLEVEGLRIERAAARASSAIVHELSFVIRAGEILGLVGESGSGKSVSAFAIAGLLPEGLRQAAGHVRLEGRSLEKLDTRARMALAGRRIGMVFQDPLSSFNPVRRVGSLLVESAMRHRGVTAAAARAAARAALIAVRLPGEHAEAYPHQLSGGQRQRAMLALALLNDPALLIADEPTTALDATVQLQILALLERHASSRAVLLITHDLAVAATICDRILVLRDGRCEEEGPVDRVLSAPRHEYTRTLLAAARALGGAM
jgi:ABC-type glutathione transport system ATPase component